MAATVADVPGGDPGGVAIGQGIVDPHEPPLPAKITLTILADKVRELI